MMTSHQVFDHNQVEKNGEITTMGRHKQDKPYIYEIRVLGKLDPSWSDWFDGLSVKNQNGETILVGEIMDQAALFGQLSKIGQLNLVLLSVHRLESQAEQVDPPR
jgi:hypothetical protein